MGGRQVRWGNVARLACLAAAGALIASYRPAEREATPARTAPRPVVELPRLADVPRLWRPRPRERRASREDERGRKGGAPQSTRVLRGQVPEHPPSPPSGAGGQAQPNERSAPRPAPPPPTSGE